MLIAINVFGKRFFGIFMSFVGVLTVFSNRSHSSVGLNDPLHRNKSIAIVY